MIAALYVETGGAYYGLPDVDLVVPAEWTREQVLEHAKAAHEPLGHTVTVHFWVTTAELWLADPVGFTDYTTGKRA